jgi:acetyl esterase/lipase
LSSPYDLAPEFASQPRFTIPSNRLLLRGINLLLRLQRRSFAWSERVHVRTHAVRGDDGSVTPVLEIAAQDLGDAAPALVDYHGGGFFLSYAALHLGAAERYALEGRCRVFFPDYRLSVGHLVGDSAGGALAAGVAQKAVDRSENPVCAQILVYPVTDHETKTDSARRFTDTPFWKTASNRNMWKVYLRDSEYARSGGSAPVPRYAAPLHRERFTGLPPAWVEVAEFDPLLDEGRQYAEALAAAGVPVELREVKGAIHGYDLVEKSPTAEAIFEERMSAIHRFFGTP